MNAHTQIILRSIALGASGRRWRGIAAAIAVAGLVLPVPGSSEFRPQTSENGGSELAALWMADARLARVAFRLGIAGEALCRNGMSATGIIPLVADDYRPSFRAEVERRFGASRHVLVGSVVPKSPAESVGIEAGDTLLAIDGRALTAPTSGSVAQALINIALPAGRARAERVLTVRRASSAIIETVRFTTARSCAFRLELVSAPDYIARTDGTTLQLSTQVLNLLDSDEDLAVVVAHELAHLPGAEGGDPRAAQDGRTRLRGKALLASEIAADRRSLLFLARAGFDPRIASRFWRRHGETITPEGRKVRGILAWRQRAAMLDSAAQALSGQSVGSGSDASG